MKKIINKILLPLCCVSFCFMLYNVETYAEEKVLPYFTPNACTENGGIWKSEYNICCGNTHVQGNQTQGTTSSNEKDIEGTIDVGFEDEKELQKDENVVVSDNTTATTCEELGNCEEITKRLELKNKYVTNSTREIRNPMLNGSYDHIKQTTWDSIVNQEKDAHNKTERERAAMNRASCKRNCNSTSYCDSIQDEKSKQECLDEIKECHDHNAWCDDHYKANEITYDQALAKYRSTIESKYINEMHSKTLTYIYEWGEPITGTYDKCETYLGYRDMSWKLTFDDWYVSKVFKEDKFALLLWDGNVGYPGDSTYNPIYVVANLDMTSAKHINTYNSYLIESGTSHTYINGQYVNIGQKIDVVSYPNYESKVYPPNGYIDKKTKDENQLFDYYIMVIDNPKSRWSGQYHILTDINGVRLEKTPMTSAKIKYSSAIGENRGTNYIQRLRYSDITYKRNFEIKSDWICRLYYADGTTLFTNRVSINANDGSWMQDVIKSTQTSNQAEGWAIGENVLVSVKTNQDGTNTKNEVMFPYEFNHEIDNNNLNDSYIANYGKRPYMDDFQAYQMSLSLGDIYEKQQLLIENNDFYGDVKRGKIIMGVTSHKDGLKHNANDANAFSQSLYTPFKSANLFNQATPTDIDGNEVTDLMFGEWRWYEHQNGIINQVFYVQPEVITTNTPGNEWWRIMCIGQYQCDCEDIEILCSCEDEEAGCNPDDASEDPDKCPENDAKADNKGGCAPGQEFCNEYGERVASNGRIILTKNYKGYNIPSGGCGGITGEGSTEYYKTYIDASTTLVE